jgi:kynureninase
MADRAEAATLDDADELRAFHDRFVVADDGLIYLDGNSLGRLPRDAPARVAEVIESQWGQRLIRAWGEGWMELPLTLGDRLGSELLGAAPGQVAVADSTTVCFYKLAAAALSARPGRTQIITDVDNFPTDRYVLESLAGERELEILWIEADPHAGPEPAQVAALISERTALVTFSQVNYRSAFILDARAITRIAHSAGALALWDLSHSAGAIPVTLDADGVDIAVGCTYKYLNGGPGAPAYLYVRAEHQGALRQPIWGWLGRRDPFEMAPGYIPGEGIAAMLSGTPPVLALAAVAAGLDLVVEAGIDAIRRKSVALTEYAVAFIDEWLTPLGGSVGSPRDPSRRGSHVALVHPEARALTQRMIAGGVIPDFRTPDVIRLGLSPLTTRFTDVYDGLDRVRRLLS